VIAITPLRVECPHEYKLEEKRGVDLPESNLGYPWLKKALRAKPPKRDYIVSNFMLQFFCQVVYST
jgi:hypothetical protein